MERAEPEPEPEPGPETGSLGSSNRLISSHGLDEQTLSLVQPAPVQMGKWWANKLGIASAVRAARPKAIFRVLCAGESNLVWRC